MSDELNDILGRIFTRNPDQRITLSELRNRILSCAQFTVQPPTQALPTPPASPEPVDYAYGSAPVNEDLYGAPLSPASSDSDGESTCSSDDGSLTSSVSTIDDLDDDDFIQDEGVPSQVSQEPQMYDQEAAQVYVQESVPQYSACVPDPCQPCPVPVSAPIQNCMPKLQVPYFLGRFKEYVQPSVPLHHVAAYHHPVQMFGNIQGCY